MAKLIDCGYDDVQCSECDSVFMLIWSRNPVYTRVEYCPFCGDEIEGEDD
jgi:hypothetical protein